MREEGNFIAASCCLASALRVVECEELTTTSAPPCQAKGGSYEDGWPLYFKQAS